MTETFIKAGVILYLCSLAVPKYSIIPMMILSICGIFSAILIPVKRFSFQSPLIVSMLIFIFSLIISATISINFDRTLYLSLSFFPALLIFFLIIENFDIKFLYIIYITFCIISFLISFHALWIAHISESADPAVWIHEMKNPYILVPNDLILIALLIPFSIGIVFKNSAGMMSIFSLLSIALGIIAITVFQSRGGLILSIMSLLLTCYLFKIRHMFYLITLFAVIVFIADYFQGFSLINKLKGVWYSRLPAWIAAWEMFTDYPLLGTGPRSFGHLYSLYQQKMNLPQWLMVDKRIMPWAHNLYLETLAEQGIFGFITFIFLIILVFSNLTTMIRNHRQDICLIAIPLFSSFIVTLIGGIFELSFIRHWFVVFFFTILSLTVRLKSNINEEIK